MSGANSEQEWNDLLHQLGESARPILGADGSLAKRFRSFARVAQAWEALGDRNLELSTIEEQMDDEEKGLADAKAAAEEEAARSAPFFKGGQKILKALDEEL